MSGSELLLCFFRRGFFVFIGWLFALSARLPRRVIIIKISVSRHNNNNATQYNATINHYVVNLMLV